MDDNRDDIERIIRNLENGPGLLAALMERVPAAVLKAHRIAGKWCAHSHACHIVDVQPMLIERLQRFLDEANPVFVPYLPSHEDAESRLLRLDLRERLQAFPAYRKTLIGMIRAAPARLWTKAGSHPEYSLYTPEIMVRHIMLHDSLHMYRIEELWLTRDAFLPQV